MNPLVTAVMLTTAPTRAAMVDQACRSFCTQVYRPMELLVVNDGELISSQHPAVRVLQVAPGLSIGEKRNIGARAAYGDYVATWDDDDFSFPERIQIQMDAIKASGARYHRSRYMWVADQDLTVMGLLINHACYPTALVHRATLLEAGAYPDLSYLEDMEVFVRLSLRGVPRAASDTPTYVHRRHGSNVTVASGQSLDQHLRAADRSSRSAIAAANARIQSILTLPYRPVLIPG